MATYWLLVLLYAAVMALAVWLAVWHGNEGG